MYIAIEGVIGVGKTTLARMLQSSFQSALLLEVFEENPFLSDFYGDRERYAFQTQIFFLLSRYHQQRHVGPDILTEGRHLIADYTFDKDAIFAQINLTGDELEMYHRVHQALGEKISVPDLIVYLRADTSILMNRIALRDRPYERTMESAYIAELGKAYDEYFGGGTVHARHRGAPVLIIDANHLDFVNRVEDLRWIENRIRQMLRLGSFQAELPLDLDQTFNYDQGVPSQ